MDEWQQFSQMVLRLRPHVQISRQHYRRELWYVLKNSATGQFHRLTASAYQLVAQFNGQKTLAHIVEDSQLLNDESDTINHENIVTLVKQLFSSDLLMLDQGLPVDFYRKRIHAYQKSLSWRRFINPLALKIPLIDPDRFLEKTKIISRILFSIPGLIIWLLTIVYAVTLSGIHWQELTGNFTDRILGANNLLILIAVFPLVKVLHELGHGYALKRWGGEVHEIGIMFLVFMPIPYVEASSATNFRDKYRRMTVAAGGMIVEVFLAAIAMILWTMLEPGMARAITFNIIFLASVSTLLFNGNPLLRYDGYFILSDYLEIPNLGPRSNQYIAYLIQRYLFRASIVFPDASAGERSWFVIYGTLSFFYRMFVWTVIILFVASKFFFIGVVLAIWGAFFMIVRPLIRIFKYLLTSINLRPVRTRALSVTGVFLGCVALTLFAIPIPYTTIVEGVIWLPEGAIVRAKTSGFVDSINAEKNGEVVSGDLLITMHEPLLKSKVNVLESDLLELSTEYETLEMADRVKAGIVAEQISLLKSRLAEAQSELTNLLVLSVSKGRFIPVELGNFKGRYFRKGEVLGYVLGTNVPTVKTVVNQQDYLLVRERNVGIEARLAENPGSRVPLKIIQEVPAASDSLPSRALTQEGGGELYLDPSDSKGNKAINSHFEFELSAESGLTTDRAGGRVFVRFNHGPEPLFWRLHKTIRLMFLSKFSI